MNNDLISRSELKKKIETAFDYTSVSSSVVDVVSNIIDNAPTQVVSSEKINCPQDLNQYLYCEPIFENTFPPDDCESRKFYGDCYHCFASAIAKRDRQIRQSVRPQGEWKLIRVADHCGIHDSFVCPFCNYEMEYRKKNFCEECGADLRGEQK